MRKETRVPCETNETTEICKTGVCHARSCGERVAHSRTNESVFREEKKRKNNMRINCTAPQARRADRRGSEGKLAPFSA